MISVITVNYNNAAGLESTIKSVAGQSGNFEYIVIDGGSTDGSKAMLDRYNTVISKGISEKDNGIYHAMNKGIGYAKGDYCLFINSGDELTGNDIFNTVSSLPEKADLIYGDLLFVEPTGITSVRRQPDVITFSHLYFHTLYHPATFIKRSLFDAYGMYNENLKIVSDYEFFFKVLLFEKVSTQHIPLIVAKHYMNGISSLRENQSLLAGERKSVHLKYLPALIIDDMEKSHAITHSRPYRMAEKIYRLKSKLMGK